MKLTRPDLVSMVLTGIAVVGIVGLSLFHRTIPDVLTYVAIGALGIGGGTALNTSGTVDSAAARITSALASLEALVSDVRAGKLTAAAADAGALASELGPLIPASVPGFDHVQIPAPAPAPAPVSTLAPAGAQL